MDDILRYLYYKFKSGIWSIGFGKVGKSSYIGRPLRVVGKKHIYIGKNCWLLKHSRFETVRKWSGTTLNGELYISDYVSMGQGCHIVAASKLVIEEGCTFSANVYVSDCSHEFEEPGKNVMKQGLVVKPVHIGKNSFVGYGACIMPGVNIGEGCIVGANAVVTKDVPSYSVVAGVPACVIKQYDFELKTWVAVK